MAAGSGGDELKQIVIYCLAGTAQPLALDAKNTLRAKHLRFFGHDYQITECPGAFRFMANLRLDVPTTHLCADIIGGVGVLTADFFGP